MPEAVVVKTIANFRVQLGLPRTLDPKFGVRRPDCLGTYKGEFNSTTGQIMVTPTRRRRSAAVFHVIQHVDGTLAIYDSEDFTYQPWGTYYWEVSYQRGTVLHIEKWVDLEDAFEYLESTDITLTSDAITGPYEMTTFYDVSGDRTLEDSRIEVIVTNIKDSLYLQLDDEDF